MNKFNKFHSNILTLISLDNNIKLKHQYWKFYCSFRITIGNEGYGKNIKNIYYFKLEICPEKIVRGPITYFTKKTTIEVFPFLLFPFKYSFDRNIIK